MLEIANRPSTSRILRPLPRYEIVPEKSALLIIDMQYYATSRENGLGRELAEKGLAEEFSYFFDECDRIYVNIGRIMAACREKGVEVIHLISEGYTESCRDLSHEWKKCNILTPKGSFAIDPRVAPEGDEIVIRKIVSGGFTGSNLDFVLRNLGVTTWIAVGVLTNQCVENTVRVGGDLGYDVIVVSDGTASYTPEWQELGLQVMADCYANVWDTEEVLAELDQLPPASAAERGPLAGVLSGSR